MTPVLAVTSDAAAHPQAPRPCDAPVYAPAVIARWLRLPVGIVRRWTLGIDGHPPVIRAAGPDAQLLSFRNVAEVHVLHGVLSRERGRVPLAIVRAVLVLLEETFQSHHVLAHPRMEQDGKELFAARFGLLTGATRHAQAGIGAELARYLQRIRRDGRGDPVQLRLLSGSSASDREHVALDALARGGEPCVAGTDVTTASVAEAFLEGEPVTALARAHGRSPEEIEEAIRFELAAR